MNTIIITGRIMKEVKCQTANNGKKYCKISVGSKSNFKDNPDDKYYHTDFFDCVAFGAGAEFLEKYRKKGDLVCINGEMRVEDREYNDNKKRYYTVYIKQCELLGSNSAKVIGTNKDEDKDVPLDILDDDSDLPF